MNGYLTESTLAELVKIDRLRNVLVRMHQGRFSCPAQDAKNIIDSLEKQGWTVRDVQVIKS